MLLLVQGFYGGSFLAMDDRAVLHFRSVTWSQMKVVLIVGQDLGETLTAGTFASFHMKKGKSIGDTKKFNTKEFMPT